MRARVIKALSHLGDAIGPAQQDIGAVKRTPGCPVAAARIRRAMALQR